MYLLDTNIFLEILLNQDKSKACELFINDNRGNLAISDFSLHSIGVILLRNNKHDVFSSFAADIFEKIMIFSLPVNMYSTLPEYSKKTGLDFDDTYQCLVAKYYQLSIFTMDRDFEKAPEDVQVDLFL